MGKQGVDPHTLRLNVYYIMLEKIQSYSDGKYDLDRKDIENIYLEQQGDAAEQIEAMDITKRIQSTGQLPSHNSVEVIS